MILLIFLRYIATLIIVALVLTQVILPLVFGRKLFPAFRRSRNKIEDEIREMQELLDEKQLKEHLEELRAKLNPPVTPTDSK